jgi:hypothetical protein
MMEGEGRVPFFVFGLKIVFDLFRLSAHRGFDRRPKPQTARPSSSREK